LSGDAQSLRSEAHLDLERLRALAVRPPLFAPHEALFWDDPHISQQMLAAHLDPDWDAASRRHATIDRSVEWLISHLRLRQGQRVLDLGCGPGLYCSRLSRRGLRVTGWDFSRNSIAYARSQARDSGLDVEYVCRNYLTLDYKAEFDVALLIYFDFSVFSPSDREALLDRVHRALRPGGAFVFDVETPVELRHRDGEQSWEVCTSGFWKPGPYVELTQYFHYPEASAAVRQVIVVEPDGQVSVYRIWDQRFSVESATEMLKRHGFAVQNVFADLTGQPNSPGSESLGIVARRR
jgi:SAM-dependent methyltransferase